MSESVKVLQSVQNTVDELKGLYATNKDQLSEYKNAVDSLNNRLDDFEFKSRNAKPKQETEAISQERKDFLKAVHTFARKGINVVQKDFAGKQVKSHKYATKADDMVRFDIDSAGALLAPADVSSEILRQIVETTPILEYANVRRISGTGKFKQRIRTANGGARILGEAQSTNKVKNSYEYKEGSLLKFVADYGYSLEMDEDTDVSMENEITLSASEDFAEKLGDVAINSSTSGIFQGLSGNITSTDSAGLSLTGDMLVDMTYAIKSAYRKKGAWMANRQTYREIRKLSIGSSAFEYLWEQSFQAGEPSRLLGAPIAEAPDLIAPAAAGTYTAGQKPIIFGDFRRGYTVGIGNETYVLRDPYSNADEYVVNMHLMRRYGGFVTLSEALVELNITAP